MATADSAGAARPAGRRALEDRLLRAWRGRGALACALWPLSLVYRAVLALRALLYRVGAIESPPLPLPVLVVGNLIAGGAGKTPAVIAVIGLLRAAGYTPAVISRGHGGAADDVLEVAPDTPAAASGDEPLLLRRRLGVPVAVGRNRVAAVQRWA